MVLYLLPIAAIIFQLLRKSSITFDIFINKAFYFCFYLLQATIFYWLHNAFRVVSRNFNRAPLPNDNKVSAKWLNDLFHRTCIIPSTVNVKNVNTSNLEENFGQMSIMYVLNIEYDVETDDSKPRSLVRFS